MSANDLKLADERGVNERPQRPQLSRFLNSWKSTRSVIQWKLRPTSPLRLEQRRISTLQHIACRGKEDCSHPDALDTLKPLEETSLDWEMLMHPEGNVYFRKTESHILGGRSIEIRFLTEDFLKDPDASKLMNEVIKELKASINELSEERQAQFPTKIDAYVGIGDQIEDYTKAIYYLVGRENRRVFWIEKIDMTRKYFFCGIPIQSQIHLEHVLEYYYWTHVRHFPSDEAVKDTWICDHLNSVLLYGCCDTQGTSESNYPFDAVSMKDLYDIFQQIKKVHAPWNSDTTSGSLSSSLDASSDSDNIFPPAATRKIKFPYMAYFYQASFAHVENTTCISAAIAQYMVYFTKQKVFNRFGEKNARVSHLQRFVNTGQRRRFNIIQKFVSFALLFAPEVYYGDLQRTFDDRLTMEDWKPFFDGVRNDWQGIVINAAVLLNANIAFLAIPDIFSPDCSQCGVAGNATSTPISAGISVNNPSTSERVQAIIAITSQASMLLSLSSIIVGLSLLKQNGSARARSEQALYHFLEQWSSPRAGLFAAAIKFSIPYVLLMYSTIAFIIALTTLVLTSQFHTVVSVFSVIGGVIFLLGIWAVFSRQVVHVLYYIFLWRPFRTNRSYKREGPSQE